MSDINDPRVLFAAERTLLAWNRTSISLMAFGFVVERFGLFLQISGRPETNFFQRHISFLVGICFILLGIFVTLYSIWQHQKILRTLRPLEIPQAYNLRMGMLTNGILGFLGIILCLYILLGFI